MRGCLRAILQRANRNAGKLLLIGLAGSLVYNLRHWLRDNALLVPKDWPARMVSLETWPELPHVSVLVAAWNESGNIQVHIESFLHLRYPHKQMVLVAGGEDGTYDLAKQYAGLSLIVLHQLAGEGKQRSLRRGLAAASGSILYLTDADCLLDDQSFEGCLRPLIFEGEQACTGISRPPDEQLSNPFVVSQAASQIYAALHVPAYFPGILGRNCALRRDALERSGGFEAPAPTGTDYVLAKQLTRIGVRIRQNPQSCLLTKFPTTLRHYLHQQRRWIYSVLAHAWHYGASDEIQSSLFNSFIGLLMLGLPIAALIFGRVCLAVWGVLFLDAWLSRIRYWEALCKVQGRQSPLAIMLQPLYLLLDFFAWVLPLFEFFTFRSWIDW